ncbi:MAG: amidohydrolase family protein, partial [Chloroflexota bacterium]
MSGPDPSRISRRRLLQLGALTPAAFLAACAETLNPTPSPTPRPTLPPTPGGTPSLSPALSPTPIPTPAPSAAVLYRGAALADGRSATLQRNVSVLVENGVVVWIRPAGGEEDPRGAAVVDAAGATIVPGLVDAHSHLTGAGGVNWIERFNDPPAVLAATGEANAALAWQHGVRWLRDVGSPIVSDPVDGRRRAASLGVRDRLAGRAGFPAIRAAGSWVTRAGSLPGRISAEAANADQLLAVALQQLDDGADLVKLYLDGPDPNTTPWSIAEARRVVEAVHARDARVAAHAGRIGSVRVAVEAGVDTVE